MDFFLDGLRVIGNFTDWRITPALVVLLIWLAQLTGNRFLRLICFMAALTLVYPMVFYLSVVCFLAFTWLIYLA